MGLQYIAPLVDPTGCRSIRAQSPC
jgi:hypothetical protein